MGEKQGHTPGPWSHDYRKTVRNGMAQEVFDGTGELIATVAWYPVKLNDTTTTTNREANARLIAAAPQMAAAIAEALSHCGPDGYLDCGKPATDRLRAALHRANPALSAGEKG